MIKIGSIFNIQPGEGLAVSLLFLYLTLALASFTIARTIRDSLFLNHYGAMDLPYAYIAVAVIIGFVVSFYVRLASRLNQATLISLTLLFFTGNGLVFWRLAYMQWSVLPAVFYIWCSIFGIIITSQVWTLAGKVLNTRQARRLFPLIGSGGILGAFLGGLLAAVLVKSWGTLNLLFLIILFPFLCVIIVRILSQRFCRSGQRNPAPQGWENEERDFAAIVRMIRRSRYMRLIVGLIAVSAVVTLIIDFQFKLAVQESFQSEDQLTGFFGSFHSWIGFISFLLQIIAGRWIVEKYGVRITLLMLPIALLSGTLILLAFPLSLWAGMLLKGSDGAIRHSVDKSTIELLFVPIPENVKAQVKAVTDMVVQRIADGAGGFILLLLTRTLDFGIPGTSLVNVFFLGIWIWMARLAKKEHVVFLRANLSERKIVPETALRAAFLDKDSVAKIRAMMAEEDEESVMYAMDLAIAIGRKDLIPASLTRHASDAVRLRAVDLVTLTEQQYRQRLNEETESGILAKILSRGCSMVDTTRSPVSLEEHLRSPDSRVRLAAVSCLANSTPKQDMQTVRGYLDTAIGGLAESSDEWEYVAKAIGEIHHPAAVDLHMRLIDHPSRTVRKNAILSAGRSGHRELVPILVRLLASRESSSAARMALQEFQDRILGTLCDIFKDDTEDIEIRRQIPLVLAHIPKQQTVNALTDALSNEDGLLRFRAIRGLNRLRVRGHELHFDAQAIRARIQAESEQALWYEHAWNLLYSRSESPDLLARLLKERSRKGRELVFRLLGLMLPPAAAYAAYKAIVEEDRSKKANAVEYLDNVLSSELKKWVMPLVEAKTGIFNDGVPAVLHTFAQSRDWVLRECTRDAMEKNNWLLTARP
jgi:ATP/ADP translocase/HEAT repeat protein